jgi:hypothetical protein
MGAERSMMPDGLKLSLPNPVPNGRLARSALPWWLLQVAELDSWRLERYFRFNQDAPDGSAA